jgi:hypothetical protein
VQKRNAYRILVGKPGRKNRGPRHRWKDNINIVLIERRWGGMDWIDGLGWGQMEGSCEHSNEPSGSMKS